MNISFPGTLPNSVKQPHLFCTNAPRCHRNRINKVHVTACSKFEGNSADILQAPFLSSDKGLSTNNDIMKLFNDAQQNILYLNKQRLVAMEELKRVRREKELLLARLGQLEAESQSSTAECEFLKQKFSLMETAAMAGGAWNLANKDKSKVKGDPPSIFSEMLLRIDLMVLSGAISTAQASEMRSLVTNKDPILAETFYNLKHMSEKELLVGLLPLLDRKRRQALHIVQICTEMAPLTDAGAVASHVTDLCRALRRRNYLVEVVLPKYECMDLSHVQGLKEASTEFNAYFGGKWHRNKIWTGTVYGIAVTFIEPFHLGGFFTRENLYGYNDDFERFTYFCRASLEYLVKSGKQPDILHLHNWHTASVAPLFWDIFVHQGLGSTRILFTCHDFKYQCVEEPRKLGLCGLDPERLHRRDRLQDNLQPRLVNLLKGGIVYSNKVVMISTPFANSIMENKGSYGLESTLMIHKDKIISVPYGLDDTIWNPAMDKYLPAKFSAEDLSGKGKCRTALRRCVGLYEAQAVTAIVGCVCLDISDADLIFIKSALTSAFRNGAQFVLMGASKTPRIQASLEKLQKDFKENCRVIAKHDEALLHLVVAGSDILLCSSFHDPQNQIMLKALKYGALPILRSGNEENGIWNKETESFMLRFNPDVAVSLTEAINHMKDDPVGWANMVKRGMMKDFSWDAECAERYGDAYWSIHEL
ncbi:hypothetical protein SUGI_0596930 [Cryptomeria japonica]|uniref:probable starch synthase 4, chloroplastic/amyloplastic isoform X2 n=1 Tax=Cryptomeria japonica TaxID=3369 RepID=UPI0024147350|nr:probable starch synthase 4, chloroplastic/amyloplastic isoform X2 [Cryptomeria japonica]GLJ30178.1 hypothetical protein SUGI_0596930 [Cryptomeria japonica]